MKKTSLARTLRLAMCVTVSTLCAGEVKACGDRPGTPVDVATTVLSSSSIRLTWRATTRPGEISSPLGPFYDIEVTDKNGKVLPESLTGDADPVSLRIFKHLAFETTFCFRIRARTEPGKGGCVSERWSARVCAMTPVPPLVTGPTR